jgi:hypothetical protein
MREGVELARFIELMIRETSFLSRFGLFAVRRDPGGFKSAKSHGVASGSAIVLMVKEFLS